MKTIECEGQQYSTTDEGYLVDAKIWDETLCQHMANIDGISLTEQHWLVIRFVRKFYIEYQHTPAIRALVKALKQSYGPEIGNSITLQQLFPQGPAKQAAKLAGLPKPARCL
jgi:tRNA 2-thiouridine synthesizing protein E|tara:strand:- start:2663 stop:2998 length:336 start_codon:yes stop_codon:yes gene_type:complete